jgi:hypothetical protein
MYVRCKVEVFGNSSLHKSLESENIGCGKKMALQSGGFKRKSKKTGCCEIF